MNHSYVIAIPSTIYDEVAPTDLIDGLRAEIKSALASTFGGYTEVQAMGGYRAENGQLIEERVYLVESAYETEDDELIERLALRIKTEMRQESVMIRKDREVRFL